VDTAGPPNGGDGIEDDAATVTSNNITNITSSTTTDTALIITITVVVLREMDGDTVLIRAPPTFIFATTSITITITITVFGSTPSHLCRWDDGCSDRWGGCGGYGGGDGSGGGGGPLCKHMFGGGRGR
jgi:uncharacterized membrane protein YgcG